MVTSTDLAQKRSNSTVFFRKMVSQLAAEPRRPYTCLAPSSWDKLIIINLPRSLEPRLTSLVEAGWGVQDTKVLQRTKHGCSVRIKLVGNPWTGETGAAGVQIRQLLLDLLCRPHGGGGGDAGRALHQVEQVWSGCLDV